MIKKPSGHEIMVVGLLTYWADKLLKKYEVQIGPSRLFDVHMYSDEVIPKKAYKIMYHPENINKWDIHNAISGIFHEIGHILCEWENKVYGEIEPVADEYNAERYSLDMMKRYYPDSIPFVIKNIKKEFKNELLKKRYKHHFIAFSQIEEYQ